MNIDKAIYDLLKGSSAKKVVEGTDNVAAHYAAAKMHYLGTSEEEAVKDAKAMIGEPDDVLLHQITKPHGLGKKPKGK